MKDKKKDTAKVSYKAIIQKILEVDTSAVDERHLKDVLKVTLRLYSHFSDPDYDNGITKEMVDANKEDFEIHHPHEVSQLAEDLVNNKNTFLENVMGKSEQKIIQNKEKHRSDHKSSEMTQPAG